MVFEADNSPTGVTINNFLSQVKNLTGQETISKGVVIIDEEKSIYIPNWVEDFKDIIDFLVEFIPKISTASVNPSPTWAADITQYITKLEKMKEALK